MKLTDDIIEKVYRYASYYTNTGGSINFEASDVASEVFITLMKSNVEIQPDSTGAAYINTAVRNRVLNMLRKRQPDYIGDAEFIEDLAPKDLNTPDAVLNAYQILDFLLESKFVLKSTYRESLEI